MAIVKEFEIYREALNKFKQHLDEKKVRSIVSFDLVEDGLQLILFKGSKNELESIKKYLKELRKDQRTCDICYELLSPNEYFVVIISLYGTFCSHEERVVL